jgi:hypothetical protein
MLGVIPYARAKAMLTTQHETIYWQSPIRLQHNPKETTNNVIKKGFNLYSKADLTKGASLNRTLFEVTPQPIFQTRIPEDSPVKETFLDKLLSFLF